MNAMYRLRLTASAYTEDEVTHILRNIRLETGARFPQIVQIHDETWDANHGREVGLLFVATFRDGTTQDFSRSIAET